MTLRNIYGPNMDASASHFFECTCIQLDKLSHKTKIMAGDFNVVLNVENDNVFRKCKNAPNSQKHISK